MRKKRKKRGSEDMANQNNGNGNMKKEVKDILHSVRLDPVTGKQYAIRYEDVYKTALARRLVILRKALGIEQDELAEMLGVSTATVSKLENGKTELTLKYREKYLQVFADHPDGRDVRYYADNELSEAFRVNNTFDLEPQTVWMRRYWDKITDYFDDFNAQAKQALEANLNFVITQSVGSKNITAVPEFSDSVIALRTTLGWGFGTFEMKTKLETRIHSVIKVPYNRMRIVRGLGYQVGTSDDIVFDVEIYTAGQLSKANSYLDTFPYKFVTDNSIESPFLFLAKGNDWSDAITFKKQYGFVGKFINKLLYPLRKVLGVALEGEKLSFGFHGMTTAGFKVIKEKDRELTIMFHYDSYKDGDGKKYSKEDFEKLVFDDLEKIVPIVREFVVEHEIDSGRTDPGYKTIRSRSMGATPKNIVAKTHGIPIRSEGWIAPGKGRGSKE